MLDVLEEYAVCIKKHRDEHNIRCKNCKIKMRKIKNDFKEKKLCKTCWKTDCKFVYSNRQDIFKKNERGKRIKNKHKVDDWWYLI